MRTHSVATLRSARCAVVLCCLLPLALGCAGKKAQISVAPAAKASTDNVARPGTYRSGRWQYTLAITNPGTKSEGSRGELFFDGKPVEEPATTGYFYHTPWGDIQWVGDPAIPWGAHGWMLRSAKAEGGQALRDPWLASGPVVMAMVLRDADPAAIEAMSKPGAKVHSAESQWFPLTDQAVTIYDTKMHGRLQARLAPARDAGTLTVILDGTAPERIDLPRQDGATKIVPRVQESVVATETFHMAFRVDRAAPDYPKPLDVGMESDGKVVIVKGAREVVIGLPGDRNSGCTWTVESVTSDSPWTAPVKVAGQPQFTPATPQTAAREGVFENTLRVTGKGQAVVELAYKRAWQKDEPPAKTFRVTLDVQEAPAPGAARQ